MPWVKYDKSVVHLCIDKNENRQTIHFSLIVDGNNHTKEKLHGNRNNNTAPPKYML